MLRKIIHIDEDKCIGCGLCVDACHELSLIHISIPNDSSAPTPAAVTRPSHMKIWRTPRSMPNSQIAETP